MPPWTRRSRPTGPIRPGRPWAPSTTRPSRAARSSSAASTSPATGPAPWCGCARTCSACAANSVAEEADPDLIDAADSLDSDFEHLFASWFNRGFLVLRHIDWTTPAHILEKIIRYEAVHEITGWDDLRRRIEPTDRRCFAFFHPALVDEPLIFVEVALTAGIAPAIAPILAHEREPLPLKAATTAVFYSISNCQKGLAGVTFGNFLIKQVVEDLAREIPSLKTFVTLSPVPGFAAWLDRERRSDAPQGLTREDVEALRLIDEPDWQADKAKCEAVRKAMIPAARRLLPARQERARAAPRSRRPLPPRQRRPARAAELPRRRLGQGPRAVPRPDGQLPLRPLGHREEPRDLRQSRHRRRLQRGEPRTARPTCRRRGPWPWPRPEPSDPRP